MKNQEDLPEGSKPSKKHPNAKRKTTVVLAAEPDPRAPEGADWLSFWAVAFLLPLLSLLSWTESMDFPATVD